MAVTDDSRAGRIRKRAAGAAQDASHLSAHFAILESELGARTTGQLINAETAPARRSYAGILALMLLCFVATLGGLLYREGVFDGMFGPGGATPPARAGWIKADDAPANPPEDVAGGVPGDANAGDPAESGPAESGDHSADHAVMAQDRR